MTTTTANLDDALRLVQEIQVDIDRRQAARSILALVWMASIGGALIGVIIGFVLGLLV